MPLESLARIIKVQLPAYLKRLPLPESISGFVRLTDLVRVVPTSLKNDSVDCQASPALQSLPWIEWCSLCFQQQDFAVWKWFQNGCGYCRSWVSWHYLDIWLFVHSSCGGNSRRIA
ncbi:CDGSH iron-sulfur domain-containing protein 2 isoform X2 [Eretmochelys imbricata]